MWPFFNLSIHMDIPLKWLTILECLDFDIETAKALLRLFTTKIMLFAIFVKLLKFFFYYLPRQMAKNVLYVYTCTFSFGLTVTCTTTDQL